MRAALLLLLCVALAAPARAAEPPSPASRPLPPLPDVALERMHPTVAAQLGEAAGLVAALAGRGDAPAADLARAYGGLGQLYLVYELYAPAAEVLERARELAAEEPRWSYLEAVALQELRRLDAAAAALERTLALYPGDAAAAVRLAQVELERRRPEQARPLFERAGADAGTRAAALFGLGRLAAAERKWSEAARHFEAALAAQPAASSIRHPLALAYRELGQLDRARAVLGEAGAVPVTFSDPRLDEAKRAATGPGIYALRAVEAARRGNPQRVLDYLRQAVALDPANDQLRQGLAAELERRGEAAAAIAEYREAVRLAPGSPLAHLNLGVALGRRGETGPALEHVGRAVALAPDFQPAQRVLGMLLLQSRRPDEALARFARAQELDPTDRAARLGRARALRQLARHEEAERELRALVAGDPQDAAALLELGVVLAERGATEEAIERLRAAVERRPDLAVAHFNLATLLAERGDYAGAASAYAQVVALTPADREAHLARARALAAAGRPAEARAALEEGLRKLPGDPVLAAALAELAAAPPPGR
jgi:tetratricopeptide (TPR) repeat protein